MGERKSLEVETNGNHKMFEEKCKKLEKEKLDAILAKNL
jgi:hypothetical protein